MDKICIYYINLERSKLRKNSIEKQLSEKNITYKRIGAINAETMQNNSVYDEDNMEYKFHKKEGLEYKITDRNVGITISHFKAINAFLNDTDVEYGIILEDDVSFEYINNFYDIVKNVIKLAPENWDIISMHSSLDRVIKECIEMYKNDIFFKKLKKNEMKSSACYIINKKGAEELLKRYVINNVYTFPYQMENGSSESIIHQLNSYLYTKPTIAIIENNITSMGAYHVFDHKSNIEIKKFYESLNA
jgi:GR25 family glycosyltransferase involved in LPS biosynthesis